MRHVATLRRSVQNKNTQTALKGGLAVRESTRGAHQCSRILASRSDEGFTALGATLGSR